LQVRAVPRIEAVANIIRRLAWATLNKSPKENWKRLRQKVGRRTAPQGAVKGRPPDNFVVPNIWITQPYNRLVTAPLRRVRQPLVLLGDPAVTGVMAESIAAQGQTATQLAWDWGQPIDVARLPAQAYLVICRIPATTADWNALRDLKRQHAPNLRGVYELILPFTALLRNTAAYQYHKESIVEMVPLYTGERYYGHIDRLDGKFPLHGKHVIEFGPMDGYQTAGLVEAGAASVTCVEARAENLIKTLVARYVFEWDNVRLIMDDMHNADAARYGRFDLAFAHGVYYHSAMPFLFLENLLSLADNVFLGGFCATDDLPAGDYATLEHQGARYRVKPHVEFNMYSGGVNPLGFYFHPDDLAQFFVRQGCSVDIITAEPMTRNAGNFTRLLARKQGGP
jgi:hypothetical protein